MTNEQNIDGCEFDAGCKYEGCGPGRCIYDCEDYETKTKIEDFENFEIEDYEIKDFEVDNYEVEDYEDEQ